LKGRRDKNSGLRRRKSREEKAGKNYLIFLFGIDRK
jgi:hypothetical protein